MKLIAVPDSSVQRSSLQSSILGCSGIIVSLGVLGDASWGMSHFVTCSVISPHPAKQHLGCQTGHSVTHSSLGVMHQSQSTSLRLSLHLNDNPFSQLHPHFKPSSRSAGQSFWEWGQNWKCVHSFNSSSKHNDKDLSVCSLRWNCIIYFRICTCAARPVSVNSDGSCCSFLLWNWQCSHFSMTNSTKLCQSRLL